MDRQVKDWINFWALEMRSPKNDGLHHKCIEINW